MLLLPVADWREERRWRSVTNINLAIARQHHYDKCSLNRTTVNAQRGERKWRWCRSFYIVGVSAAASPDHMPTRRIVFIDKDS